MVSSFRTNSHDILHTTIVLLSAVNLLITQKLMLITKRKRHCVLSFIVLCMLNYLASRRMFCIFMLNKKIFIIVVLYFMTIVKNKHIPSDRKRSVPLYSASLNVFGFCDKFPVTSESHLPTIKYFGHYDASFSVCLILDHYPKFPKFVNFPGINVLEVSSRRLC